MKKEKVFIVIGGILLIIGIILSLINVGGDNVSIAQQVNNAQEAALAISANNQKEILVNAVSMFLIGLGGLLIAATALQFIKKRK